MPSATHGVTHMCGAPIVYTALLNAPAEMRRGRAAPRFTARSPAAAPPAALLEAAERGGVDITHVYGLTENYGPASVCPKHEEWASLPLEERAELNSRQGVRAPMQEGMVVLDPETMQPVPWDGSDDRAKSCSAATSR